MRTLFNDFGRPEKAEGDWLILVPAIKPCDATPDGEPAIELRIRRMPDTQAIKFETKYGREDLTVDAAGRKRAQRVLTGEESLSLSWDKAAWAWTDCKNLGVSIEDEDAAEFYGRHLGKPITVGTKLLLDGQLNDAIKRRLFGLQTDLAIWCIARARELSAKFTEDEKEARGN